jgi:hypothetical protein
MRSNARVHAIGRTLEVTTTPASGLHVAVSRVSYENQLSK